MVTAAGSRQKGATAEREIVRLVTAWWRDLEPTCEFARTPSSGGWGTKELRSGFRASGDLMTTATRFPYVIEVKRRESGADLWLAKRDTVRHPAWGWWAQAKRAAAEMDGSALLIYRRSRSPWNVVIDEPTMRRLRLSFLLARTPKRRFLVGEEAVYLVRLADFLAVPPVIHVREAT